MTETPPPWPGQALRRPPVPAADPPTLVQPAAVPADLAAAGRHHAGDDAHRDPRGWWWTARPHPADWRPPTPDRLPVAPDGPTLRLDLAAIAQTREEHR
ncbi:hypothetical protein [Micromonospora pallida]|uniref:hypothetical protein n=1 Tax=Micromonospora pallida TaxID=145854 RepID=UPI000B8188E9|nr:hypothetical protein [Micromonospora pallida]